jgi:hypothetical protein
VYFFCILNNKLELFEATYFIILLFQPMTLDFETLRLIYIGEIFGIKISDFVPQLHNPTHCLGHLGQHQLKLYSICQIAQGANANCGGTIIV